MQLLLVGVRYQLLFQEWQFGLLNMGINCKQAIITQASTDYFNTSDWLSSAWFAFFGCRPAVWHKLSNTGYRHFQNLYHAFAEHFPLLLSNAL